MSTEHADAGAPLLTPEGLELLRFAAGSRVRGGFGWLDDRGRVDPSAPRHTWIAARMTYVFSLATALGLPGTASPSGSRRT